jgi:hypothetical protein
VLGEKEQRPRENGLACPEGCAEQNRDLPGDILRLRFGTGLVGRVGDDGHQIPFACLAALGVSDPERAALDAFRGSQQTRKMTSRKLVAKEVQLRRPGLGCQLFGQVGKLDAAPLVSAEQQRYRHRSHQVPGQKPEIGRAVLPGRHFAGDMTADVVSHFVDVRTADRV